MTADPRRLNHFLGEASPTVSALLVRAQMLERVEQALQEWLGEPWSSSIRVANLRGDSLIVFADSAAALTKLRYSRDDVLAHSRQRLGLDCNSLIMKVKPTSDK